MKLTIEEYEKAENRFDEIRNRAINYLLDKNDIDWREWVLDENDSNFIKALDEYDMSYPEPDNVNVKYLKQEVLDTKVKNYKE